jgi:hypothetical protein
MSEKPISPLRQQKLRWCQDRANTTLMERLPLSPFAEQRAAADRGQGS